MFQGFGILRALYKVFYSIYLFTEQIKDVNSALYNIAWYELKPKEQKLLILLIIATQHSISLSAGGINDLTYEWFSSVINGGYSTALILQDLL